MRGEGTRGSVVVVEEVAEVVLADGPALEVAEALAGVRERRRDLHLSLHLRIEWVLCEVGPEDLLEL